MASAFIEVKIGGVLVQEVDDSTFIGPKCPSPCSTSPRHFVVMAFLPPIDGATDLRGNIESHSLEDEFLSCFVTVSW